MISYITSENNRGVLHLAKQINGKSETLSTNAIYDIGTFGWTTDVNANWITDTISYDGNYVFWVLGHWLKRSLRD